VSRVKLWLKLSLMMVKFGCIVYIVDSMKELGIQAVWCHEVAQLMECSNQERLRWLS